MNHSFFRKAQALSILDIAKHVHAKIDGDDAIFVTDIKPLNDALETDLTFFHNPKYFNDLSQTKAGVVLVEEKYKDKAPESCVKLVVDQPYRAFGKIALLFYPKEKGGGEISPLASIDKSAVLGRNITIEPFVTIKAGVHIGDGSIIKAHVSIGENVQVGENAFIEDHVTLSHCILGNNVYIKPGARIGQSGFGFHMDQHGHFDIPQLGCVRIGHNVQIGSNTCIDRGSQYDTIIHDGVRIDNLVQIAHNVEIGENSVIVAQVGIAGSSTLGKFVIAAGQVGIAGHLKIGNFVKIASQGGVIRNLNDNETVAGTPCVSVIDWHRQTIALKQMIKGKK